MGIYYNKQLYFKAKKAIGKFELINIYKTNNYYKVLPSQPAQQIPLVSISCGQFIKGLAG